MNPNFQRLMQDATRLTRSGDLQAATQAIRTALAHARPDVADDAIDVQARVVEEPAAAALTTCVQVDTVRQTTGAADAPEAFVGGRFGFGAAARDYKLYVPPGAGSAPLPLVVMLHGCTQDPDDFAAGTGMNDAARTERFYVLYPAQSAKANPQRCWNWFKHSHQERGRGEAGILAGMTADVLARHRIDPSRVYVAGLSAGGAMAAILAQSYPDVFAAAGVHSGLPAGAARDLPTALQAMKGQRKGSAPAALAVPTIVFHGDADATVDPANGERLFEAAASASGTLQVEEGRAPGGRLWTRRIKLGAADERIAEHWQVHGAPHAWSGGRPGGSYTDPRGPDATAAMLRFFWSHRLRAGTGPGPAAAG